MIFGDLPGFPVIFGDLPGLPVTFGDLPGLPAWASCLGFLSCCGLTGDYNSYNDFFFKKVKIASDYKCCHKSMFRIYTEYIGLKPVP